MKLPFLQNKDIDPATIGMRRELFFPIEVANRTLLVTVEENIGEVASQLNPELELYTDYFLIPEDLWQQLLAWGVFSVDCDIATVLSHN